MTGKSNLYVADQGIEQQFPVPKTRSETNKPIRCRNVLDGVIHDYYREAR